MNAIRVASHLPRGGVHDRAGVHEPPKDKGLCDERYTASHLLGHLDEVLLADDTLAAVETVVGEREHDMPTPNATARSSGRYAAEA